MFRETQCMVLHPWAATNISKHDDLNRRRSALDLGMSVPGLNGSACRMLNSSSEINQHLKDTSYKITTHSSLLNKKRRIPFLLEHRHSSEFFN
ncbi:hypothetical protein HCAG_08623 [Histoplasma mississippiense (nom. inval.)]|uniref:hypothetical protein n=1 Tax=Ajellomyces capsulatus (strain NAm1 / WU24) TaxID=2059318 RepID=UPI000157D417|nr:hypothetical protein HCAG_08623 [Histoplasma mississippiense (nom. inval.)]EDN04969.1 hypothetical protein HCAG_08623 [Histoplasma mississippiense (nom. inval.)]